MFGTEDAFTVNDTYYWALCLAALGRHAQAASVLRGCDDINQRIHGKEHDRTLETKWALAQQLMSLEHC